MRKVQLCFTLIGKSNAWERGLSKDAIDQFTNAHRLGVVCDLVSNQFGNRALVIMDENKLTRDIAIYPEFFSAGWFVSQDGTSELVIVEHGNTMEGATKAMMEAVRSADWDNLSAKTQVI